jgi:hypothetical protein
MLRKMLLGLALSLSIPAVASANEWTATHPRRAEVNARLANQNERVREGVADGRLSPMEARRLHREDRMVRHEERAMAAANGGHLTRREARVLNRQENRISRQISREKRR